VLRTYGFISDGQPLWSFGWDGQLRPFDAALPRLAEETFWQFSRDGASVLWQRNAKPAVNGLAPIDQALLGFFELDLATGDTRAVTPPDSECPAGRSHRFEARDDGLVACDCAAGGCDVVTPLPVLDPGWDRWPGTSPDGCFVLLSAGWPFNAAPMTWPDTLLFDASGAQLSALPSGRGAFDEDSRLLLFNTFVGMPRMAIIELETARVTWLPQPYTSTVMYE
jgi:hypothetical protein